MQSLHVSMVDIPVPSKEICKTAQDRFSWKWVKKPYVPRMSTFDTLLTLRNRVTTRLHSSRKAGLPLAACATAIAGTWACQISNQAERRQGYNSSLPTLPPPTHSQVLQHLLSRLAKSLDHQYHQIRWKAVVLKRFLASGNWKESLSLHSFHQLSLLQVFNQLTGLLCWRQHPPTRVAGVRSLSMNFKESQQRSFQGLPCAQKALQHGILWPELTKASKDVERL